ncbi:MAG: hypothetical protein WAT93_12110 [Pontixanthobacter sp.]
MRYLAAASLSICLGSPALAQSDASCQNSADQAAADYNYVLGTQAIGGFYQFSKQSALLEQVMEIRGLGSNLMKLSLGRGSAARYGTGDAAGRARTTLQYLKTSPDLQQVFDMEIKYYQAWVHSFTAGDWRDGVSPKEARAYYDEMYELAAWLLTRYSGSGKVFMLGNWEGDWLLNGRGGRESTPSMKAVEGMTDWLNIRQKAIDDAKAAISHENVELYHYVEVNLVEKAMAGKRSIARDVLPKANVDLVSYSSYEAIKKSQKPDLASIREPLRKTVSYLEGQLQPKPGLPFERRVFIGEYGYHANKAKPQTVKQQFLKSRYVMQVAIELDLPFALIWQLYNNEYATDGTSNEMSLIDESGQKRALYYLHRRYLEKMTEFVAESCRKTGKEPAREAFKGRALEVLENATFGEMEQLAQQGVVE